MLRAKLMMIGSAFVLALLVGCEQQGPAEGGGDPAMQQEPSQQPGGMGQDPGMQQQEPAQTEPGSTQ